MFKGGSHRADTAKTQVQPKFNRILSSVETGVQKARVDCKGPSRTDRGPRTAVRRAQARGRPEPRGVEKKQVREENGPMLGSEGTLGDQRREDVSTVRHCGHKPRGIATLDDPRTGQPGMLLAQT